MKHDSLVLLLTYFSRYLLFNVGTKGDKTYEIPHGSERRMSDSKDAGTRRGWIVRSHIDWRGESNILIRV